MAAVLSPGEHERLQKRWHPMSDIVLRRRVGMDLAMFVAVAAAVASILTALTALLSELRKWRRPSNRDRKS